MPELSGLATQLAAQWDTTSIAQLRKRATAKWSRNSIDPAMTLDGAWVAESDFGPAPMIAEALSQAVADNNTGYMPAGWDQALIEACARFQADRHGWEVDPSWVQLTPDVLSILRAMIRRFTERGDGIIVPTPAYMPFLTIPPALGRRTIEVESCCRDDWHLNLEGIEQACREGAKLLILCNPWNPTGRVLTPAELRSVAEIVERYEVRVFSDEIHSPLVLPGNQHVPFASISEAAAKLSITATAASKAFNIPGLKSAQAIIVDDEMRTQMSECFTELSHYLVPLGVLASTVAYNDGREWLDAECAYIADNVALVHEMVSAAGLTMVLPQATYLTWWDTEQENAAQLLAEKAGVAVNPGCDLGRDFETFIRFNAGTPRPVLREMLERCLNVLR